jgi:uncharacterized membrane protein YeaQ/YmgE (transglycosylase-associated protein family)
MTLEAIVIILIIGGIAGWLAGLLMQGYGFGIVGNILIGIAGGFLGTWLLGQAGVAMPGGPIVSAILTSLIGAIVLVLVIVGLRRIFAGRP